MRQAWTSTKATTLDLGISKLGDLEIDQLRARWRTAFRKKPSRNLPRHLLVRMLAYHLQATHFGDLDHKLRRQLDGPTFKDSFDKASVANRKIRRIAPGTIVAREWNGKMQRVTVLNDGFAWNGKQYRSLSQIASQITGTRWNGPRFFGLRDRRQHITS